MNKYYTDFAFGEFDKMLDRVTKGLNWYVEEYRGKYIVVADMTGKSDRDQTIDVAKTEDKNDAILFSNAFYYIDCLSYMAFGKRKIDLKIIGEAQEIVKKARYKGKGWVIDEEKEVLTIVTDGKDGYDVAEVYTSLYDADLFISAPLYINFLIEEIEIKVNL